MNSKPVIFISQVRFAIANTVTNVKYIKKKKKKKKKLDELQLFSEILKSETASPVTIGGAPSNFNIQELFKIASATRGATYRSCRLSSNPSGSGAFNFTVPLLFDDGVEWIAKCSHRRVF